MKTLVSHSLNRHLLPQFSSRNSLFHFPSLSRENPDLLKFSHKKRLYHPQTLTFWSVTSSGSLNYGGWDDPRLGGGSFNSDESNQIRNLLNSLGIDDKRYIFMYLLGFICALSISRVRVSSIVVFPVSVLVFALGFSFGFVNGGHVNELSFIGSKKRPKDENLRVSVEKLRNLLDSFVGVDGKISNLKHGIRRGIESHHITVGDLENYFKVMESIGSSSLNARSLVEACIENIAENHELERTSNQKPSKRKKEMGETRFDLLQLIGGLFQENSIGPKANKTKDSVKRDSVHVEMNDQSRGNILGPLVEEKVLNSVSNGNAGDMKIAFSRDTVNKTNIIRDGEEKSTNEVRRINSLQQDKMAFSDMGGIAKRVLDDKQYGNQNNRLGLVNKNDVETWPSHDRSLDSGDFSFNTMHMETEELFEQEHMMNKTNGSYKNDVGSFPSSMVSEDIKFNRYLVEANALLKEAKECLRVNGDEGHAEIVLSESVKLLSKAIEMKPMSLLAVGQLGNTYLLHGELKLKISRELRALLAKSDPISVQRRGQVLKGIDDQVKSKDKIASVLVSVCEECEQLLVEAGRKYKLALSIDGNDTRALYNWGLALSFRAQLIAAIGPEAAFDADKIFLAAIDKFDAMMSKSNVYTPDALFRWGVALQQRSRLRPRNSKEKVKLLQQAKRLYEDALDMDSDNLHVKEALCSCISELSFRSY
ncbi:hypothetical protein U1Q18_009165 [Sarracenia purpurea var. burkii]